ncbi:MAG: Serine/threonine protein kinaserelated protein [Planctomycetaceae bacterium]|nr:Serine/threonine protein kinaserelated protein [Planctomycetaceae bacterium]
MAPSPKTPSNGESASEEQRLNGDGTGVVNEQTQFAPFPASPAGTATTAKAAALNTNATKQEEINSEIALGDEMILGEFRLLRRLGRGGMAEVYLAEQTLLKRHVAIKVMRPELTLDETLRQRFQKEALAVAGLNHPNIVQVYTVGEAAGRFYIAQEYVNGQNLREYLTRKGPPELPVALIIMKQVAAALQAAAQAGIVHRDIKPENIMLGRKSEVKVTDFGLAKRGQTSDSQQLTQFGTTMGTPLYMSPEQIQGKSVDQRSDLYSYGVTCYHMLAGHAPFRGESAIAIAMQHLKDEAKPLEKIRPDLPALLCRIIHKCLEKDPDARYQSAASVIKDLKRVTQEKSSGGNSRPTIDRPAVDPERLPLFVRIKNVLRNPTAQAIQLADLPLKQQVRRLAVFSLLVLILFAGIGWIRRPADPLKVKLQAKTAAAANTVPQKNSPAEQYWHASTKRHDIAAWEAVRTYFPNDKVFTPAAVMELGLRYLSDQRPADAMQCFDQLVSYGEIERQWQAAGWAGQAAVMNQLGDYDGAQKLLMEKIADRRKDLPRRIADLPRQTAMSIVRHVSPDKVAELKRSFEETLPRRPNPPN